MHFSHNDNKISVKKQMNQLCKVHKELGWEGGGVLMEQSQQTKRYHTDILINPGDH